MSKHPVVHFEMPYDDAARAKGFYEKAFGWKMVQYGADMGNYIVAQTADTDENGMVKTPGTINGGLSPRDDLYTHPNVVIAVDDIAASVEAVRKAGGRVVRDPMPIPGVGTYAVFHDTEGNRVSLLQPAMPG